MLSDLLREISDKNSSSADKPTTQEKRLEQTIFQAFDAMKRAAMTGRRETLILTFRGYPEWIGEVSEETLAHIPIERLQNLGARLRDILLKEGIALSLTSQNVGDTDPPMRHVYHLIASW